MTARFSMSLSVKSRICLQTCSQCNMTPPFCSNLAEPFGRQLYVFFFDGLTTCMPGQPYGLFGQLLPVFLQGLRQVGHSACAHTLCACVTQYPFQRCVGYLRHGLHAPYPGYQDSWSCILCIPGVSFLGLFSPFFLLILFFFFFSFNSQGTTRNIHGFFGILFKKPFIV